MREFFGAVLGLESRDFSDSRKVSGQLLKPKACSLQPFFGFSRS
jgi:hypothetical protein